MIHRGGPSLSRTDLFGSGNFPRNSYNGGPCVANVFMQTLTYAQARLAAFLFFSASGLAYGLFTARIPSLKEQTGAASDELGLVLFALGAASVVGLSGAAHLVRRFGVKAVSLAGCIIFFLGLLVAGLANQVALLAVATALVGLGFGLLDVAVNVAGIEVERRWKKASMNVIHAGYNVGVVAGSISAAVFTGLAVAPLWNFVLPCAILLLVLLRAQHYLPVPEELQQPSAEKPKAKHRVTGFVVFCGVLSSATYVTEGASAEWGSLFLHQVQGAPESMAALCYGVFGTCALSCRLIADRLRAAYGDVNVFLTGAVIALCGMTIVLFAPHWTVSLAGYAVFGTGLAPVVPILFALAGRYGGMPLERATSVVALFAYGGLLFFPPFFGFLAEHWGLLRSLSVTLLLLTGLLAGGIVLKRGDKRRRGV